VSNNSINHMKHLKGYNKNRISLRERETLIVGREKELQHAKIQIVEETINKTQQITALKNALRNLLLDLPMAREIAEKLLEDKPV
jgi:hypothetical protein